MSLTSSCRNPSCVLPSSIPEASLHVFLLKINSSILNSSHVLVTFRRVSPLIVVSASSISKHRSVFRVLTLLPHGTV